MFTSLPPIVAPPLPPLESECRVKKLMGEEDGSGEALWGYLLSSAWHWLAVCP